MPHKTDALLDPAAAIAFIEGYKRFLLTAATGHRAGEGGLLETLVGARSRITKDPALLSVSGVVHLGRNYLRSFASTYEKLRRQGRFEVEH